MRTTEDLIRITAAGGGVYMQASAFTTEDLIRIAAAASRKGAHSVFRGLQGRTTEELIRIGAAGGGAVAFEL